MSNKPLPISELLRRVGDENIGVQFPLTDGSLISCDKRKHYAALEFAAYPGLAEELAIKGSASRTLLAVWIDSEILQRAKADHNVNAPLPLTERERDLLAALHRCLPAIRMHANADDCDAAESAIARAEGRL